MKGMDGVDNRMRVQKKENTFVMDDERNVIDFDTGKGRKDESPRMT